MSEQDRVASEKGRSAAGAASGSQASPGAAEASPPSVSIPYAICAYPLPGWRLDKVQWDERDDQPNGWIVSLKREHPDWTKHRCDFAVMARSDVGPLEAWGEALRIALREDERAAAQAATRRRRDAR